MKKIHILVLTLLLLLCGQTSFGQGMFGGDLNEVVIIKDFHDNDGVKPPMFEGDFVDQTNNFTLNGVNLLHNVVITNNYHEPEPPNDSGDCNDPSSFSYPCVQDSGDPCDSTSSAFDIEVCYGIPDPDTPEPIDDIIVTWYLDFDGDGYHSATYQATTSPGNNWSQTTSGPDCDDTRSQYTTECCTKTCESGYKLNVDTCGCEVLPPCFGTIKDYETSNAFNSTTILNKLNSALDNFGISTDVMDIIKQMDIFDPKAIAAGTDVATHANAIAGIGDVSQVLMSYSDYIDEPSTQNLLRLALDTASTFLSPAASLAISTVDYFKDSNGDSKLDLLLKAASDEIDRSLDCNLGLGIRNGIF